jgi:hypothetical protein
MTPTGPAARTRARRSTLKPDNQIKRVVLCTGKVYYDLSKTREKRGIDDVYILRVEQLYPFPARSLIQELERFPKTRRYCLVPGRAAQHGRMVIHRAEHRMGAGPHRRQADPAALCRPSGFGLDGDGALRPNTFRSKRHCVLRLFRLTPISSHGRPGCRGRRNKPTRATRSAVQTKDQGPMAIEIRVPTLGESVTEATVGQWFKKPGEAVNADEPLVELETDKVTVEVPAPSAGTLSAIS